MSNRGGSSGNSDYTNDTLTGLSRGAKYTLRANLNRTRQENVTVTGIGGETGRQRVRQFQSLRLPTDDGSVAGGEHDDQQVLSPETINDSSRNLQLSANWMPSSALTVELSRSRPVRTGVDQLVLRVHVEHQHATRRRGWPDLNPGKDGGEDDDDGATTTRPSSEDVTDNLSVTWSPARASAGHVAGQEEVQQPGRAGVPGQQHPGLLECGARQMSDALSLNLGLGSDTMEYLDEERGTITNRSLMAGATYRPPGARWNTSLNLNIQDGSSPTYVGYGRLQKYRSVSTHLFDLGGQLSYDIGENLTLYASAGVSDYDGGYSAFKKTSGEIRARYQFSQTIGLDLGFRSIKNVAGQTMDDLVYGTTGQGQDYIANTFLLSLSRSFQGGLGGAGGTVGPSYTGGPGTFGGYQPGLRTGSGRYGGSRFDSGFGSGSTGTGYGSGRFDTIGQRRTTTTTGPFGAPSWETTDDAFQHGRLSEGLGGFRKDDKGRGEGRRAPGTLPSESDGQDVPEDWWLLDDNAGGW